MLRAPRLAALPLLLVVSACSGSDSDKQAVEIGTVLDTDGTVEGQHVFVNLPTGRVDVVIGQPTDDLPVYDDTYDRAADGADLVGVQWNWDFQAAFASMQDPAAEVVEPHIALVADGREYSLDDASLRARDEDPVGQSTAALDYSGAAWVAVEEGAQDLAISVEFDGVEQVADLGDPLGHVTDSGPATALYTQPDELALRTLDCGAPRRRGADTLADTNGQCLVDAARVPYHPAVGWVASREQSWLVLRTSVRPDVFPDEFRCGEGTLGEATYHLDGEEPATVVALDPGAGETGRDLVVFAVDRASNHDLTIDAVQRFDDPLADCRRSVPLRWEIGLY